MQNIVEHIQKELAKHASADRAIHSQRFFKTGKGDYGANDMFIGITVPQQRRVAKMFRGDVTLDDITTLLHSPIHEYRLTALFLLTHLYEQAPPEEKEQYVHFYVDNLDWVNNWDLVDTTAYKILGDWLLDKTDRKILTKLAISNHLWRERVSVVATFAFIKHYQFDDMLMLAGYFITHPHDLLHKAVGWMLREVGKRDEPVLRGFLDANAHIMPRTMLRYAIEKLDEPLRQQYLQQKKVMV